MSALVIILLSTVLIQGSAIALGNTRALLPARLSIGMELREAAFTLITVTLSAMLGFAIVRYLLLPTQSEFLRTPAIVLGVAAIVTASGMCLPRSQPASRTHSRSNILVLLTNQCALLGIALFTAFYSDSPSEAFMYGLGSACALAVLSVAFRALIERIDTSAVPFIFRGIPLALISAGLTALALMGFAGIVRH